MSRIKEIRFKMISPEIIRKISVMPVVTSEVYGADAYPIDGGVMDPRLGIIDPGMRCSTCGGRIGECTGHFGHIELARPIINILYLPQIRLLLTHSCHKCGALLVDKTKLQEGISIKKLKLATTCPDCGEKQGKIKLDKPSTFVRDKHSLTSVEVREHLEKISDETAGLIGIKGGRPEWFILTLMLVPPVTARPSITLENGDRSEDDLTHKLVDIIRINHRLADNLEIGAPDFIIEDLWELLQYHISTYFNNEISSIPPARHRSGRSLKTLAQRLKSKDGRFRHNLTGKRVNYCARTVVSPDPNISLNEVGIPDIIAKELTIPIKVAKQNINEIKKYIQNGPGIHPGANYVTRPDGIRKKVINENKESILEELTEGYTIERHLIDGDIVLFNRQPSLHRMSVMAHYAKIMPHKTFRLNLCVCKPYNADFDGDEMNLHVPQTAEARSEAEQLMLVEQNIKSPRFGGPIMGCDQDYISGAYLLTRLGTEFTKQEVAQILTNSDIITGLKKDTYTGKELFSFAIPKGIDLEFKANTCRKCQICKKAQCENDAYVIIENGELKKGVVDTNGIAAFKGKIIDNIDIEKGHPEARKFIDSITKIISHTMMRFGFSISLDNLDTDQKTQDNIQKGIDEQLKEIDKLIEIYKKGEIEVSPGRSQEETLEDLIMIELWKITNKTQEIIDKNVDETNTAIVMARTGARGSIQNLAYMSGLVGQETIRGRRIFRGYTGRTLSHFKKGDLSPASHGFVRSSFQKGIDPIEFFFEVMKGREGIMDSSLKTRVSGYMQRRLVSALQDIKVGEDFRVRDSSNTIIQFTPGEDGIDPAKSDGGYINKQIATENRHNIKQTGNKITTTKELPGIYENMNLAKKEKDMLKKRFQKIKYEVGEAVGVIAAQSISEPATQTTLRAYHSEGRTQLVTTKGLPRLIELFDARKIPKTPTMEIYLDEEHNNKEDARKIAAKIKETKLKHILKEDSIDMINLKVELVPDKTLLHNLDITTENIVSLIKKGIKYININSENDIITIEIAENKKPDFSISDLQSIRVRVRALFMKGIKGIEQAIVEHENEHWIIKTLGSNLKRVLKMPGINITKTTSNNIFEVAETLGIEAARNAIINEATSTMREQGVDTDIRHLLVVADAMTNDGTIKAIGRYGLAGKKSSVLSRANFEETVKHLTQAASAGEIDPLESVIENIIIGNIAPIGTGMIKLKVKD